MTVFENRHPHVGAHPGTLVIPRGSPAPRIKLMRIDGSDARETEVTSAQELATLLSGPEKYWVDIQGWGNEALLRELADVLHIHPLALEDAINFPQRPKAELYEHHLLIITRTVLVNPEGVLTFPQVSVFLGEAHVVTFQEHFLGILDVVRARVQSPEGKIHSSGPDFLAYTLVDALIDRFYPEVDDLERQMEEVEELVSRDPTNEDLQKVQQLRRVIVALRRISLAQKEMVRELTGASHKYITDEVRVYLRDTQDHTVHILDVVDSLKDTASSLMDIYLSVVGQRTNEVMKVLTILSSIFVPLTFLAGVYGMNFRHMPELGFRYAYPVVLALMGTIAVVLLAVFRARGWIGRPRKWARPGKER